MWICNILGIHYPHNLELTSMLSQHRTLGKYVVLSVSATRSSSIIGCLLDAAVLLWFFICCRWLLVSTLQRR